MLYLYAIAKIDPKGVRWFYEPNRKEWEKADEAPPNCLIASLEKAQRDFFCFKNDFKYSRVSMWKYKLSATAISDTPEKDFSEEG